MMLVCTSWMRATRRGARIPARDTDTPVLRGDVILVGTALYDAATAKLLRAEDACAHDPQLSPDGQLLVVTRNLYRQAKWSRSRDPRRTVNGCFSLRSLEKLRENTGPEGSCAWVDTASNVAGVACVGVRPLYDCDSDSDDVRRWYITAPDGTATRIRDLPPGMQPLAFSRDASALLMQRQSRALIVVRRDGARLSRLDLDSPHLAVRPTDRAFALHYRDGGTVVTPPLDSPPSKDSDDGPPRSAPDHFFRWWAAYNTWTPDGRVCAYHQDGHVCVARGGRVLGRVPLATRQNVSLAFDASGEGLCVMLCQAQDCFVFRYLLRDFINSI